MNQPSNAKRYLAGDRNVGGADVIPNYRHFPFGFCILACGFVTHKHCVSENDAMSCRSLAKSFLALSIVAVNWTSAFPAQQLDVPMDRSLVTVLIRFGLNDTEPSTWKGSYRVTEGQIIATDGWRFAVKDYATVTEFQFESRRLYPRFWNLRGRDPKSFRIEPNGVSLTLSGLKPSSALEVETSHGRFQIPVGQLGYGSPKKSLEGAVDYQRVPTSRQIVKSPAEDGYPSAAPGPNGVLSVAYVAFTHGDGFEKRPRMLSIPTDFSFLAQPTGGDQVMFTEFRDGQWSEPIALSKRGGDVLGTAVALDGQGQTWVAWAENVAGNWDLFAKFRNDDRWSDTLRVTDAAGSDFDVVATTDSKGRVWLAWQNFGETNSNICVARQDGDAFGTPMMVATSPANDWSPAIAASADGQVAVAWDSYERGTYDIRASIWKDGTWSQPISVAETSLNEARASLAFDQQNRLWIAYEKSPEGWGKDYGPYDQSPKKTSLYRDREIGVRVLDNGILYVPVSDINRALPRRDGRQRYPKDDSGALAAGPKLAVDASGRLWLSARVRVNHLDSAVGGTWLNFLTTLDSGGWRSAFVVPGTDGFLHESVALVPAPESGLQIVSASDGRLRTAASFGYVPGSKKPRPDKLPPLSTRTYADYADPQFNKEISVADTGILARTNSEAELKRVVPDESTGPSREARQEAKHVAAMRAYRADVGGKSLRIVRGEFHRHTEISSDGAGDGSIFDMWRYGLDMAALDWIGSGDHDNGNGREFSWWFTQKTTSLFAVPGTFTPMYTYERSVNYPDGHRNAVFAQRGIRPLARLVGGSGKAMDDLPADAQRPNTPDTLMFYKYLHQFGGVCASHTSGTDMGTDWRDNDPKVEPIVEIYQGDRQSYERPGAPRSNSADYSLGGWRPLGFVSQALLKGYRLGFQSSSDHISTHMSYCNVWVDEPTPEAIIEGMRNRHVYGATDNIIADVRCGKHFMGDEFTVKQPPTLKVKLVGTAPFAEVVIVKDNEYVYTAKPDTQSVEFTWTDNTAKPGDTSYYYIRGTQVGQNTEKKVRGADGERVTLQLNNGEIVWVSPMWITYHP